LPVISRKLLVPLVQQAEDDGVEGVFAYQVYGPPFIPLALAAGATKTLTRMAAQIGDGVIGHPIWSIEWALNEMKPAIEDELQKCNKARSDIEVGIWPFAAINPSEQEALDDARPTVAFYAGAELYEIIFEKQGFINVFPPQHRSRHRRPPALKRCTQKIPWKKSPCNICREK
jgi:alkanesulfonate monooxygenase SsuD/methylene tetrahydromethanopterin reductase-like flavin-dependent oxidoreductase (luciferase family)